MKNIRPPAIARAILMKLLPPDAAEFLVGDLDEEYRLHVGPGRNRPGSHLWYWWQGVRTIASVFVSTDKRNQKNNFAGETARDIRYAIRSFCRTPAFTALAVLTLAMGIGSATAIFSAVNQLMLSPLPFHEPDRLVQIHETNVERGWTAVHAAPANVQDWRERVDAFSDIATYSDFSSDVPLSVGDGAVQVNLSQMSANLFDVLGVSPMLGRTFVPDENWDGSNSVVILSHSVWASNFGSDFDLVGKTIRLDGMGYEVIGVMPERFDFSLSDSDVWTTHRWSERRRQSVWFRQAHVVRTVARLGDGVSPEVARGQLDAVAARLQSEHPDLNRGMEAGFVPLHTFLVGDSRTPLLLLLGAVGLLLLIAGANVANLLLVRSVALKQELAVRAALGAAKGRLLRQVLAESVVLAFAGGLLGVAAAALGLDMILRIAPPGIEVHGFQVDWRMVLFGISVVAGSALFFGSIPAFRSSRANVRDAMGAGSRTGSMGRGSMGVANSLVAAELGLALMLAVGAGLLVRTITELKNVDAGVDSNNVLTFAVRPPSGNYGNGSARLQLLNRLSARLREIPGVVSVGSNRGLPLQESGWTSDFKIAGWGPDEFGVEVRHREGSGGYFRTLGIPIIEGEVFEGEWDGSTPLPVVVNEAFANRYFPTGSPVGKAVTFNRTPDSTSYWYRITAVVGNERRSIYLEPEPEIIANLAGDVPNKTYFVLKTSVPPLAIARLVQDAVSEIDAEVPVLELETLEGALSVARSRDEFIGVLFGIFAFLAVGLACIGVYGVASQVARQRRREIGIRLAMGATGSQVARSLVRKGLVHVLAGVGVGVIGSMFSARLMGSLLFNVAPIDPVVFVSVTMLLISVGLIASYLPARRAGSQDLARVLNSE